MAPWTLLDRLLQWSPGDYKWLGHALSVVWLFLTFTGVPVPIVFIALLCNVCDVVKMAKDVLSSAGSEPVSDSCLHQPTDKALHANIPWEHNHGCLVSVVEAGA